MRISDWSSDVCSSDLFTLWRIGHYFDKRSTIKNRPVAKKREAPRSASWEGFWNIRRRTPQPCQTTQPSYSDARDRKKVVEGKSVSVRVDLGGRRIINKKKIKKDKNRNKNTKKR